MRATLDQTIGKYLTVDSRKVLENTTGQLNAPNILRVTTAGTPLYFPSRGESSIRGDGNFEQDGLRIVSQGLLSTTYFPVGYKSLSCSGSRSKEGQDNLAHLTFEYTGRGQNWGRVVLNAENNIKFVEMGYDGQQIRFDHEGSVESFTKRSKRSKKIRGDDLKSVIMDDKWLGIDEINAYITIDEMRSPHALLDYDATLEAFATEAIRSMNGTVSTSFSPWVFKPPK